MLAYKKYIHPVGLDFFIWWVTFTMLLSSGPLFLLDLESYTGIIDDFSSSLGVSTTVGLGLALGIGLGVFQFFILYRYFHYSFWWILVNPLAGVAFGNYLSRGINALSVLFILQAIIIGFFVGVRPRDLFSISRPAAIFKFLFILSSIAGLMMTVFTHIEILTMPEYPGAGWVAVLFLAFSLPVGLISGAATPIFFLLSARRSKPQVSNQDQGETGPRE